MIDYSIQLWSVQSHLEKDFEGTLKALSEMGYTSVEFAGFNNHSAEEIVEILDKYNLKVSGTHSPVDNLLNNFDETVAFHKAIGNKNYIIPCYWTDKQADIDNFVSIANELAPKLRAEGIELCYHNHGIEFTQNADGSLAFDQYFYRTDISFEIDVFWAYVAMKNPVMALERAGKRVKFVHIKDGTESNESRVSGKGDVPIEDVFNYCVKNNLPMVVENEPAPEDELTEAKLCLEYLRSLEK